MSFAIYVLLAQEGISAMRFLVGTGFVIFTLETLTIAFLHYNAFFLRASQSVADGEAPPPRGAVGALRRFLCHQSPRSRTCSSYARETRRAARRAARRGALPSEC